MLDFSAGVADRIRSEPTTTIVTPAGQTLSLEYFVGWGGPSAVQLAKSALELLGTDLTGRRVLDVGFGHGKMSCLLALLGAQVVGVDIHGMNRPIAQAEAKRWGVSERTAFTVYSGDPKTIQQTDFDIVFTKSMLLLISDLETFLRALATRLRPGGQVVFIENGFHNPLSILSRRLVHWWRDNRDNDGVAAYNWHLPAYLSTSRINAMRRVFDVRQVTRAQSRHWYLIHGFKRD
jgi:SAM-dependent methyltransferase